MLPAFPREKFLKKLAVVMEPIFMQQWNPSKSWTETKIRGLQFNK